MVVADGSSVKGQTGVSVGKCSENSDKFLVTGYFTVRESAAFDVESGC
jgi:hypothetical protein